MSIRGSGPAFGERAEYGAGDVCYRHPKVHSFTLCQRCGRTICPDCQVTSAVGVLCPECTREAAPSGAKRMQRSTRAFGRRVSMLEAPVTTTIIVINAVVFILQLLSQHFGTNGVTHALWYAPLYSLPADLVPGLTFEPWRMLTSIFTHSTGFLLHILFNMYALWLFGRQLELMLGRALFSVLYLFAGFGGSLGVMLWVYADPSSVNVPTVGASGAIFGILAATLLAMKAARINMTSLAVLIGINFAIGLVPGARISWQAHLGGMIVGALTMWLLLKFRGPRKRTARITTLTIIGVVLVALSFAYFVVLP